MPSPPATCCARTMSGDSTHPPAPESAAARPTLHNVVVLHAGSGLPRLRKARRPKGHRNPGHPHMRVRTACGQPHRDPDRVPQAIVLDGVEPEPALSNRRHHQRPGRAKLARPVFRILQHTRACRARGLRQFLAKLPTGSRSHRQQHGYLVVAEPILQT